MPNFHHYKIFLLDSMKTLRYSHTEIINNNKDISSKELEIAVQDSVEYEEYISYKEFY